MSDFRTGVNGEVVIDPNEILGIEQDTDPTEDGVSVLLWPGRWRIRGRSLAGTGPGAVDVSWGAITGKPATFPPDTEATQDVVGSMIVGAGGTYDDAAGTITLPAGGGGGGASELTPVTSNTTSPAGTQAGQLVGYLNTASAAITVNGQPLAAGAWALFGWSGSAWVQMNTGTLIPTSTPVTATAPTFNDASGTAGDTYTIPTKAGVEYLVGGTVTAAGTYPGAGTVTITAQATSGYTLTGTSSWSHTFDTTSTDVTPPTPGTLAASQVSDAGFTLTVTGASDSGSGLNAQPYAFDAGGGYGAWQASPTVNIADKSPSTTYTVRHKVRDVAGNEAVGTAIDVTTIATPATPTTLAAAASAYGAAAYWPMTETSGTTIADATGNGHTGTLSGSYTLAGSAGMILFNDTSGAATVPDHADFTPGPDGMSLFMIVNSNPNGAYRRLVEKGGEWRYQSDWGTLSGGYINSSGSTSASRTEMPNGTFQGSWAHIAITAPAPATNAHPTFYLNSSTPGEQTNVPCSGTPGDTALPLIIGGIRGALGHVMYFRRQLTPSEIGTLMTLADAVTP